MTEGPPTEAWLTAIRKLYALDGNKCRYCGFGMMTYEKLVSAWEREHNVRKHRGWPTIDHVRPQASGGRKSGFANIVIACRLCQRLKANDPRYHLDQRRVLWFPDGTTEQRLPEKYRSHEGPKKNELRDPDPQPRHREPQLTQPIGDLMSVMEDREAILRARDRRRLRRSYAPEWEWSDP